MDERLAERALELSRAAARYSEMVKKYLFHGHPWDRDKANELLSAIVQAAEEARDSTGSSDSSGVQTPESTAAGPDR